LDGCCDHRAISAAVTVRVAPGTWRGYEAGPEGLEIFVIGAPNLGESPRDDVEGRRDWWAD
jgi:hypothetical protein